MREDIVATIRRALVDELFVPIPAEQIGLDDDLGKIVGLDSIGFSELWLLCEKKFDLKIADAEFSRENFATLRRVAALVERLLAAKAASV